MSEIKKTKERAKKAQENEKNPIIEREVKFELVYLDGTKNKRKASLTSLVPNAERKNLKMRILMQLAEGLGPFDTLPQGERNRLDAISRVMTFLQDPPDWVTEAIGEDDELLVHLNQECLKHEAFFFRGAEYRAEDQGEASQPRIALTSELPDPTKDTVH